MKIRTVTETHTRTGLDKPYDVLIFINKCSVYAVFRCYCPSEDLNHVQYIGVGGEEYKVGAIKYLLNMFLLDV